MNDARIEEIKNLLPKAMTPDWVRLGSRLVRLLKDQHHPDAHNSILNRLLEQARASVELRERRRSQLPRIDYPPSLPISASRNEIVTAIRSNQVIVIAGETGSGKTTQIPKMCLEAGLGIEAKIGCTQPRRVAALSISRRIAEELNVTWGKEVGCKIRFDDRSSSDTYIKMMTDGILLAETQGDPLLSEYNAIIIDEAHERSLNIDFLLGYLKGLLAKRPDLKLIITSATIDTEAFSRAFNNAPIIEVSGRTFPVEVIYAPFDAASEESGDLTFIDAAVSATEKSMYESGDGDILIFMPGERDIRETSDQIEGRFGNDADVIPLYGRLSSGDQQRVFAPSSRRKIVIATNIAETSLTIPGIRYVIDAGLARISRYNSRTRTKRLPVEPVSQSSANQRKGRSGRVQNGICIRLYSEEDFNARPPFTQPEIQRANLAEVILRMKAFRLGEIESFPFLNPPTPAAIDNGYKLLQELGALDENRDLTPLGRDLARLPIDPTLGRMLLQSQREHATQELLIIAAGLSIQDPRERPLDQKSAADAAHKRFLDPQSDFLALLNIWNAVHDQWDKLRTQNQRRKFCKANFLSYTRMREWQDLYTQLHDALDDIRTLKLNESNAAYDAIHRSILAGLLGHVATKAERNLYKATGNRQLTVFPGSVLYDRTEKPKKPSPSQPRTQPKPRASNQPQWIVAGEIVETSQLFARTVAGIDPLWILQIAPHLCKLTHHNPHWSANSGRVLADEKVSLYGMEIHNRRVVYGNINPKEATDIFIRSALVEENLFPEPPRNRHEQDDVLAKSTPQMLASIAAEKEKPPARYQFLENNRQVRQKIETWQTRMRRHDLADLDKAMCEFYARRIENVSSLHELNRLLRDHPEPGYLCVTEADLIGDQELKFDAEAFPDSVSLANQPVALSYAYAPGEEMDGVTLKLPLSLVESVSPASTEWAVPGLRESLVSELLRALPKTIRRELMPFPPKVAEITRDLRPTGKSLKQDLANFIKERYHIEVSPTDWPSDALPQHLRPRIEIVGNDHKTLGAGRDLSQLREQFQNVKVKPVGAPPAWKSAAAKWERFGRTGWTFGDLPERITVSEGEVVPVYGWPGLQVEENHVNVHLFPSQDTARRASLTGVQRLVELALQKDLAWLQKDLRGFSRFQPLLPPGGVEELQESAFENLKRFILPREPLPALTENHFNLAVNQVKSRIPGLASQLIDRLGNIFQLRQDVLRRVGPASTAITKGPQTLTDLKHLGAKPTAANSTASLANELEALFPKRFLESVPYEQLAHYPRYLKALHTRAERAKLNPLKDQERSRQLAPYQEALRKFQSSQSKSPEAQKQIEEFRWLVEEFKVSIFAQELGTAVPVSAKRLDQELERVRQIVA
ncbi:ATP-dependent RNA helicase HrpA [Pedosphaera parvula]|nr:ATP-dependent RNA helicase HrpA [Pedosphaera parvula]